MEHDADNTSSDLCADTQTAPRNLTSRTKPSFRFQLSSSGVEPVPNCAYGCKWEGLLVVLAIFSPLIPSACYSCMLNRSVDDIVHHLCCKIFDNLCFGVIGALSSGFDCL